MTKLSIGFIIFIIVVFPKNLLAQNDEAFKPNGKAFGRIFANYHQGINQSVSDEAAFELVRAYLGYEHFLSNEFSAKINLDIGSPDDLSEYSKIRRYAYFKNAYVQYKKSGIIAQFGLISLKQFDLQEKIWERRYLKKSFADEYKLGSSADLGMSVSYKFPKQLSVDFTIMNGEGYSSLQGDDKFKYGLGATFDLSKSLIIRWYSDYIKKENAQSSHVLFVSYTYKNKLNIACEYNYQFNNNYNKHQNLYGYSVFGKYYLAKNIQLFARFDKLQSNILSGEETPWQLSKDGSMVIAGIQYSPVKGIKVALDYQDWYPWAANIANQSFLYFDIEVSM